MKSKWATEEVGEAHGYFHEGYVHENQERHDKFAEWLKSEYKPIRCSDYPEPGVFDIGCGPGNLLNSIPKNTRYVGIDCSLSLVNFAADLHGNENTKFFTQDIESDISEEVMNQIKACNICYVDSTITMLQNPRDVLEGILIPNFNFIFLQRCDFISNLSDPAVRKLGKAKNGVYKSFYRWNGMTSPSIKWHFTYDFFRKIGEEHGFICDTSPTFGGVLMYRAI